MRPLIALALMTVVPTVLLAQSEAPAPAEPVKEKRICRSDVATGSMMTHRTCRTKAEWAAIDAQARKDRPVVAAQISGMAQDALIKR